MSRCLEVGLLQFVVLLMVDHHVVFVVVCTAVYHCVACSALVVLVWSGIVACILDILLCWHTSTVVDIFRVCVGGLCTFSFV